MLIQKSLNPGLNPIIKSSYDDILVIGIGESEQNRRAYESHFVESLREVGTEAEASYKLIKSNEKIERDTVVKAIEGMEVTGVLITHMVAVDEETIYRPSMDYMPMYGGGYYGGMYSYYPSREQLCESTWLLHHARDIHA